MKFSKFLFLLCTGLIIFSCNPDDEMDVPTPTSCVQDTFSSGILVVNEGPFQSGAGSLSLIDDVAGDIHNAYARNNCDSLLGNIVQSATVVGDKIAVVVNNANLIRVLDASTMEETGVIQGLSLPRYLVAGSGNLAYVSQWGTDGVSGSVVEVNLESYDVLREVATGSGPEELQFNGGMLYIPHVGGFGQDSSLVVVDPSTMAIVNEITTGVNPHSLVIDGTDIWVLNQGAYDFMDPALNLPGSLVKIVNNTISESFELSTGVANLAYHTEIETFFWTTNSGLGQHAKNSNNADVLIVGAYYDLAIHPTTGLLYLCNAKDFNSTGEIIFWDPAESISTITSKDAGIIPGEIIFY